LHLYIANTGTVLSVIRPIILCHATDQIRVMLSHHGVFIHSLCSNMVFVVDEAVVQQVFPMLVISPPLLYIPCNQGLVQHSKGLSLTSLLQLVQQAAVPGAQCHLTAIADTVGCSTRD